MVMACTCAPFKSTYDVFLSFRGSDTRNNITSHLYAALRRKQVCAFIDENGLNKGDDISSTLMSRIEECKCWLIVFSQNYASSPWCLDELVKILECATKLGTKVVPIFYHVEPSHVRHLTGKFGEAFREKEDRFRTTQGEDMIRKWSSSLRQASYIAGWNFTENRVAAKQISPKCCVNVKSSTLDIVPLSNEAHLVEEVAEDIARKVKTGTPFTGVGSKGAAANGVGLQGLLRSKLETSTLLKKEHLNLCCKIKDLASSVIVFQLPATSAAN